ncbi:MAG: glycosyltransferase family 4 protein [Actinomycetaceae bacterium]|nr:glycosyltransferase family 4 protein [Actinomycetaceae bacterium]
MVANELCAEYDVHIVNLYGFPEKRGPSIPLDPRVTVAYLGRGEMPRLRQTIVESFNPLRKYLQDQSIDICFLQTTYMGIIGLPIAIWNRIFGRKNRCKIVFHDHGAIGAQLGQRSTTLIRKVSAIGSDLTIVLTERSCKDYQQFLKIPAKKLRVVTNWIDPQINPDGKTADLSSKTILWAGRLSEEKGALRIPEIAQMALQDIPDWQIHVYGDGPEREKLAQQIQKSGLEEKVLLKGVSSDMYREVPRHAIGILTSDMEGMPMFLLEATAFQQPCVAFDVLTGPNEIINDGKTGYLIEPYDTAQFARKLRELVMDDQLREEFSRNIKTTQDKFSVAQISQRWRKLITELS